MIGYGLGVYEFKGRNVIFVLVLIIMMVPLEVMMLPLFKLTVGLHLIDSYFRKTCWIRQGWTAARNSGFSSELWRR